MKKGVVPRLTMPFAPSREPERAKGAFTRFHNSSPFGSKITQCVPSFIERSSEDTKSLRRKTYFQPESCEFIWADFCVIGNFNTRPAALQSSSAQ
jgi:hypothetical protein